jgi:hypothetical protein
MDSPSSCEISFATRCARRTTALVPPKEFIGAEIEITGSELTNPEAAEVFGRVLGKKVKFQ